MAKSVNENLLLIFVKNPERGKVKTRLAESVGEKKALRIYNRLLQLTKSVTDKLNCIRQVWYSEFIEDEDLWSTAGYEKRLQAAEDLGERMKEAFRRAFDDGYEKTVIIGSDCAELTPLIIEQSFRALDDADIVIGPSEDGGYYLLGMTSFNADVFNNINWSTPAVYDATVSRIKNCNLSMHTLPELNDIDTKQDLIKSEISIDQL